MTADEAVEALLGGRRTGDMVGDLIEAAKESQRRRQRNSEQGGAVIAALREQGLSWRDIERATGIPRTTAERWATSPPIAETD